MYLTQRMCRFQSEASALILGSTFDVTESCNLKISILNAILHFISYAYLIANLFTRRRPRHSVRVLSWPIQKLQWLMDIEQSKPKPAHSGLCPILNKMSNQEAGMGKVLIRDVIIFTLCWYTSRSLAEHRLKLDKFQQRREIECAELDDLISLDAPNALDACLEECKSDFKNISTKVQRFSKLWTSVSAISWSVAGTFGISQMRSRLGLTWNT